MTVLFSGMTLTLRKRRVHCSGYHAILSLQFTHVRCIAYRATEAGSEIWVQLVLKLVFIA